MTKHPRDELFRRYLGILGWAGDPGLHELVSSHLIKVPFENVSKLLRPADAPAIPTIDEFLRGIAEQDLGGTCYAIAFYFAELLAYLDYEADVLAADVGAATRAHAVCRVDVEGEPHLVDVGYGAPFYEPYSLVSGLPRTVPHGDVTYVLDRHPSHPEAFEFAQHRGGARGLTYVARPPVLPGPEALAAEIERSHDESAPFMRRLRIARFFASRAVEIDNNRLIITHHNITTTTPIRDIDELEAIVHETMQLPRMPVREAVAALRARGVDIFADPTA